MGFNSGFKGLNLREIIYKKQYLKFPLLLHPSWPTNFPYAHSRVLGDVMCVEIHNNPQTHPAGMCWSSSSCNPVVNNRQGTYKYSD